MTEKEFIDIIERQNTDLIYLMLEVKGHRGELNHNGITTLFSMKSEGTDRDEKYSINDVNERIKEYINFLDRWREKNETN